jgi:hypothetical protein
MFTKLTTLAVVAMVATASPFTEQLKRFSSELKVAATTIYGDPLPNLPYNFEASCNVYIWTGERLSDTGYWGYQKWSSDLNMIYDGQGIITDEGDNIPTDIAVSKMDQHVQYYYSSESGCSETTDFQGQDTKDAIDHAWDGLTYSGLQFAPWDLSRQRYNRLDGNGVQYYYKQQTNALRYIVEIGRETRVYDYGQGFVEKSWTEADFVLSECQSESSTFLQ